MLHGRPIAVYSPQFFAPDKNIFLLSLPYVLSACRSVCLSHSIRGPRNKPTTKKTVRSNACTITHNQTYLHKHTHTHARPNRSQHKRIGFDLLLLCPSMPSMLLPLIVGPRVGVLCCCSCCFRLFVPVSSLRCAGSGASCAPIRALARLVGLPLELRLHQPLLCGRVVARSQQRRGRIVVRGARQTVAGVHVLYRLVLSKANNVLRLIATRLIASVR